jgi:hypothetical protein
LYENLSNSAPGKITLLGIFHTALSLSVVQVINHKVLGEWKK